MTDGRLPRRGLLTTAGLAASGALLGGCGAASRLLVGDPARQFTLTPKSTFDESLPDVFWQLLIEMPIAATALDSVRIALQSDPFEIQYYSGVAWAARAPAMVQTLLVESFENSNRIVAVGRESIGLRANYVLKTELREFQAEYPDTDSVGTASPTVRVRLNAKLVRVPERTIIGSRNFEDLAEAGAPTIAAVVTAFDEALGSVMGGTVEWTLQMGEADWVARQVGGGG
ncbi:MAG: membrane integrity-associated transporter subunit PqiC [Rhodospirillaceae bacterium]|nr:membrane integrity-associated transporter subunit PqiC [Rhodospirillaceae bacterium]